jgi:hypothetical protein
MKRFLHLLFGLYSALAILQVPAHVVSTQYENVSIGIAKAQIPVQHGIVASSGQEFDAANTVFLVFDIGQSNSIGRATSQRIIQLTADKEAPNGIKIFYKPDYTSTDNGVFQVLQEGSLNTREPDQAAISFSGAYGMLAARLKRLTPDNYVYVVAAGDGGTAIKQNLTSPDWAPASSGECFQRATEYYYSQAYADVQSENPGKTIIPIICWHQGESDAADNTATTEYATNFAAFVTALRASHSSLADAMLIITKLYYQISANETTINNVFQTYADANSSLVKIVDISDQPRKQDLTVAEQGGIAGANGDDEHTSYLGQAAKADRSYTHVKTRYAPNVDDSEIQSFTFNVGTISSTGFWLPFDRSTVTIGTNSTITGVTNSLSTGTFSTITASPKFKLAERHGSLATLASTTPRIACTAAIGNTLIDGSFSWSAFVKPRDGNPSAANTLWYDIANVSSVNNSRAYVLITTTGKVQAAIAISGTLVTATTASAVWADGNVLDEKHIAVVWPQGGTIQIYVDGVLQSLDATENGNISALTLSNYNNTLFPTNLFCRQTGSSTFDNYFIGTVRHMTCQPVAYSTTDIANLMTN